MTVVNDAIILAGGMGTRMLPASLYAPKEVLPLLDTPLINHLIWEAELAGVRRIHLVLSQKKVRYLEDFLKSKIIHGNDIRRELPRHALMLGSGRAEVIPHVQKTPGGIGNAMSVVGDYVDGPFLVLLGDMLVLDDVELTEVPGPNSSSRASKTIVSTFEQKGLPCIGAIAVDPDDVSRYGIVVRDGHEVKKIVEKPLTADEYGNLGLCGRYVFPAGAMDLLKKKSIVGHGELQSIRLLNHYIKQEGLNLVEFENSIVYDGGNPISWLKAQIDHGLRRRDVADDFDKWLRERLS